MKQNKNSLNLLIVGVGGQGTLLASRVIGHLAAKRGLDVKVSEVHGMSQRGGSVVTYVKYADEVASPLIEPGEADIIIAFELLEAARWLNYLSRSGITIANEQKIDPMPVIAGNEIYPEGLIQELRDRSSTAVTVDALSVAMECGSVRSVNFVLLGIASTFMDFSYDEWIGCIREVTPQRAIDVNIAEFDAGMRLGEEYI